MVVIKVIFLEIRKIQSQKNRRRTQPIALSKLKLFSEVPMSQQNVVRHQLIRNQKILKEMVFIKKFNICHKKNSLD